ncbi:MAG: magnesium transporter [Sulfurimonadaceae bacterium]|jgi:magnesium transporter|nr:magnesium transporter [Sulfurimonadaceae bacterium]
MEILQEYFTSHNVNEIHPSDVAKILKDIDEAFFSEALNVVPINILGDVILSLPERYFSKSIVSLPLDKLSKAVKELDSDDQVEFMENLQEYDEDIAINVFDSLSIKDQSAVLRLQNYKDFEAGAYMQTEVFTAQKNEIVQDVVSRFSKLHKANMLDNVQNLFITDKEGRLLYTIGLDDLLTFDFTQTVVKNIEENQRQYEPKSALDRDDVSDVVHVFEEYELSVMPVIDINGILVGRITSDHIYDIISEKATEQMYSLAGIDEEAEDEERIFAATKHRAFWLGINIITAFISSVVIALFAETIESIVAIAVLMPIVASMGGNVGIQSLTVVVRQLSLGSIELEDAKRIIKREVSIALLNGMLFALIVGFIAYIWFDVKLLGVVIALSMVINLFIAGLVGSMTPLILKKAGVDPAVGSSVILTFFTDAVGFFSFLGLATWILL